MAPGKKRPPQKRSPTRPRTGARKKYSFDDLLSFAGLSGDYNPLHCNPFIARRELFGDVVVHGIRVLLDGLDLCASKAVRRRHRIGFSRIQCLFQNPVYLNAPVVFTCDKCATGSYHLEARGRRGVLLVDANVSLSPPGSPRSRQKISAPPAASDKRPAELSLEDLRNRSGRLALTYDRSSALRLFPHLVKAAPPLQIAELLCITRLVGMKCPGLRSVLSSLDIHYDDDVAGPEELRYHVASVNERFLKADLEITAPGMKGTVKTFVRPGPRHQPSFAEVGKRIEGGALKNHIALIIGGTRGLGEITAKIIAAGGGYPVITWFSGASDAEKIKAEILASGGRCASVHFDATRPEKYRARLAALDLRFTAMYYFATPKIFVKKGSSFDAQLLRTFKRFYVTGLNNTYSLFRKLSPHPLVLFNPSSVAIEEKIPELMEYALAKKASEELCGRLAAKDRQLTTVVQRLPRTATDQTMTLTGVAAADALEVMLPIVKKINALLAP
jgi:NAD(P)-dependent dehydrogenase (short-subunit alcohol dehydrogenase family)